MLTNLSKPNSVEIDFVDASGDTYLVGSSQTETLVTQAPGALTQALRTISTLTQSLRSTATITNITRP